MEKKNKQPNVKEIIKDIEIKTEKKVINNIQTGDIKIPPTDDESTEKILKNIMKDGANEFKEKMGREMTYGEMREMYG